MGESISLKENRISPLEEWIPPLAEQIPPLEEWIPPLAEQIPPLEEWISPLAEQIPPLEEWISPLAEQISPLEKRVSLLEKPNLRLVMVGDPVISANSEAKVQGFWEKIDKISEFRWPITF